jgi:hypothetical protein
MSSKFADPNNSRCVACGEKIGRNEGVAFRSKKAYKLCVAKYLNYDSAVILKLSVQARICSHNFPMDHINSDNLPIKVPTLSLYRISAWPVWKSNVENEKIVANHFYLQGINNLSNETITQPADSIMKDLSQDQYSNTQLGTFDELDENVE